MWIKKIRKFSSMKFVRCHLANSLPTVSPIRHPSGASPLEVKVAVVSRCSGNLIARHTHPKLLAYAHVYGPHNYDAHALVPIGMEMLVYEKTPRRKTFAKHCKKGFVVGTSFEHYRVWMIWMSDTRATRVSGTVFHKHKYISALAVTPADAVITASDRRSFNGGEHHDTDHCQQENL